MKLDTDICILGGGIMGAATAYSICKTSGSKVLVLDRYGVGNDHCSSNDANRVFRYSYGGDEYYTRMAVESLKLWRQLEKETGQELLVTTGLLMLEGEDDKANKFNEASYRTLTRMGLGADRFEEADLTNRFPQFRTKRGFFDPHGGVLLASKALATITSRAQAHGVRFLTGQARRIRFDASPHVETVAGETVQSRKLVVTVGPWSNSLLRDGLTPVTPTRQQLIYFRPRKGLDHFRPKSCPVFFMDKHYGLPAVGINGVKVSPKELTEEVDPETARRSVDREQVEACRDVCRRFVPELGDGEVVQSKVCLYDMTENSDFVLDRDPENFDVVYGYGFSGHGFKFAPVIGELLAEFALDRKPSFDLERFTAVVSQRRAATTGGQLAKSE